MVLGSIIEFNFAYCTCFLIITENHTVESLFPNYRNGTFYLPKWYMQYRSGTSWLPKLINSRYRNSFSLLKWYFLLTEVVHGNYWNGSMLITEVVCLICGKVVHCCLLIKNVYYILIIWINVYFYDLLGHRGF